MTAEHVDEPRLVDGGWARVPSGRGSDEARLHELRREQVIIWLPQSESSCIVMARVRDAAHYDEVMAALVTSYGAPAERRANGSALWLEDSGAGIQADKSGSGERLGIRLFLLPASH